MDAIAVRLSASKEDDAGLRALRFAVFVDEQGVPADEELDSDDDIAVHAVAVRGGVVVGTGRLVLASALEARVGRMAVGATVRRQGVGGALLRFLDSMASFLARIWPSLFGYQFIVEARRLDDLDDILDSTVRPEIGQATPPRLP